MQNVFFCNSDQIKSKLLVFGAVNTTINDQECQHVTGRLLLSKQASTAYICSVASFSFPSDKNTPHSRPKPLHAHKSDVCCLQSA